MKFDIVNKKKIIAVLLTGFVVISITGCHKNEKKSTIIEPDYLIQNDEIVNQPTNDNEIVNQPTNDNNVIISLEQMELEIDNELLKSNNESSKSKLKENFIKVVDFVFYDTQINGKTFKDLTDEQKEQVLGIINKVDTKIITKYPTYKEDISELSNNIYLKASELIKKGASNIKEFSYDILGEENYNNFIEGKDKLVDSTKDAFNITKEASAYVYDKGKEKVKNWYEGLKK